MSKSKSPSTTVSELRSHTGFWLRFVSNHVSHAFSTKLLASRVTAAEWVVLREIYDQDEISPSQLAENIGMTRGAASKLIDRLVHKKLISRKERSDDRRYQHLTLTLPGRRLVPNLADIADQNDQEFFSLLSAREHRVLLSTLKKLAQSHRLHKLPTE